MEAWGSAEPVRGGNDRWRAWATGRVTSISELCAIYICNTRTRGFGSGVVTWSGQAAMLWAVGWATNISEPHTMSWQYTYTVDLVLESLVG